MSETVLKTKGGPAPYQVLNVSFGVSFLPIPSISIVHIMPKCSLIATPTPKNILKDHKLERNCETYFHQILHFSSAVQRNTVCISKLFVVYYCVCNFMHCDGLCLAWLTTILYWMDGWMDRQTINIVSFHIYAWWNLHFKASQFTSDITAAALKTRITAASGARLWQDVPLLLFIGILLLWQHNY